MGLLMVIRLSPLVFYGIAEGRLQAALGEQHETLHNQIGEHIKKTTLRWFFQLLRGIHCLRISLSNQVNYVIEGLTAGLSKILRLFYSG